MTSAALHDGDDEPQALIALCVLWALLFNFGLALVNANIAAMSSKHVIVAEALLVIAVHAILLMRFRASLIPWYVLTCLLGAIAAARWSWLDRIDPKSFRDVLLIPTFVCLGMIAGDRKLDRLFLTVQISVFLVALVELTAPDFYSAIVNVKQYYINTRGFGEGSFWNQNSDLFVSATRPTERAFFPSLGTYRASSVFLEPVSLGNYCIIITAYIVARWNRLSAGVLTFLIISNIFLLIASDGRLAVVTSALLVFMCLITSRLPSLSAFYLPGAIIFAFAIFSFFGWDENSDDFAGRVGLSAQLLSNMDTSDLLGLTEGARALDSGIAYLIQTQSIFGLGLLWAAWTFGIAETTTEQARVKHGILLYIALTMMVSYSFLTIKTAALAWFLVGATQAATVSRAVPERKSAPLAAPI